MVGWLIRGEEAKNTPEVNHSKESLIGWMMRDALIGRLLLQEGGGKPRIMDTMSTNGQPTHENKYPPARLMLAAHGEYMQLEFIQAMMHSWRRARAADRTGASVCSRK